MIATSSQAKAVSENGDGVVTFSEYKKALEHLSWWNMKYKKLNTKYKIWWWGGTMVTFSEYKKALEHVLVLKEEICMEYISTLDIWVKLFYEDCGY